MIFCDIGFIKNMCNTNLNSEPREKKYSAVSFCISKARVDNYTKYIQH